MRSVEPGAWPAIRVRPVPQCDPPFDDELMPEPWAAIQPALFDWPVRRPAERRPSTPPPATTAPPNRPIDRPAAAGASLATRRETVGAFPDGRPASRPGTTGASPDPLPPGTDDACGKGRLAGRPGTTGASPDARMAVRRFVSMCVEVFNGYRPAAHLRRMSAPKEAARVVAQGVAGARRIAELRRVARPGDRHARRPGPVGVLGLRLCEPRQGAVEAAVLLVTGERTWAMALRLEEDQRGWAATVLRLI